ncbi:MAG: tyrosine-type recombinase/integrase [Dolichospermum sp.]
MNTIVLTDHSLESSLSTPIGSRFTHIDSRQDTDVLNQLLADKRAETTRRAYLSDINNFFNIMTGDTANHDAVLEFLHLSQGKAVATVLKYKAALINKGLKEATVNRRIAAIKSLVVFGRKVGVCSYSLEDVKGEKTAKYRDTTGVDAPTFKSILQQCDLNTVKGIRDYAILRLLWGNALRRGEVSKLNKGDFDPTAKTLRILGKGKGTQYQTIDLSPAAVESINNWLSVRGQIAADTPLFSALDNAHRGHRLTGDAIRKIVCEYSQNAGIAKTMSPHRVRHSAITAALDATGGDVRKVQKLSRHSKLDTLMIYDDNRKRDQGEITNLLDDLL